MKCSRICSAAGRRACSTASSWSDEKIAVSTGAYYLGTALDDTRFYVWSVPAPDVSLETLDAAVGRIVAQMASEKASEEDLARAKTRLIADAVYAQDSQSMLARWYGAALTTGETVEDVQNWPVAHRRGDGRGRARGGRQMARPAPRGDRLPAAAGRRRQGRLNRTIQGTAAAVPPRAQWRRTGTDHDPRS